MSDLVKPASFIPRSKRTLAVGVTGHRPNRLPARQIPRIAQDLTAVMSSIAASNPNRRSELSSGLAEGADRLAAFTALGLGWKLRALLAFHRTRFEEDFPSQTARGEFRALLKAAHVVEEPRRGWERGRPAEDGYEAVGKRLVARSDILIAVWDGEGARGRGGTADVIENARSLGIPVMWVHAAKAETPRLLKARRSRTSTKTDAKTTPRAASQRRGAGQNERR